MQQFRNVIYLSDVAGTGFWRHIQQVLAANCITQNSGICNTFTQIPVVDQKYYRGITSVTVQRWISDEHSTLFNKFLKPICDANNAWLMYAIDDAMHYDEIPLYNRGRAAFANDKRQENIKQMLNNADFVVTTTKYIKDYYHEKYGVPLDNIIAVPNLLPRWWFDDKYSVNQSVENFKRFKAKPRIGIISSLSHYNIDNIRMDANGKAVHEEKKDNVSKWINQDNVEVKFEDTKEITDDIDEIIDTIKDTVNDVQWVFFGFCPPKLAELAKQKKIEVYPSTAILNYPSMLKKLKLQAIVAPLKKTKFNFCKSPIKYLESCAIGTPLFATNCKPYSDYMDSKQLYDTPQQLKEMLLKLKFMSVGAYTNLIESNYAWLNSQHEDGDFTLTNYWLEDNLKIWIDLFRLRSKTMKISYSRFIEQYEARMKKENENTIFKNDNGVEIIK